MSEVDELYNLFSGKSKPTKSKNDDVDVDLLYKQFSADPGTLDKKLKDGPTFTGTVKRMGKASLQGVSDVLNTIGSGIGYIDRFVGGEEGAKRSDAHNARVALENEKFKSESVEAPFASDVGRIGGQIAATAPFVPARVMQGISSVTGALPAILTTGERIAAPLINRIGALSLQGGTAGTISNTLTTAARPDTSLPVDMTTGFATGVVAGPVMHGSVVAAAKALSGIKNVWANIQISRFAQEAGIDVNAAKRILNRLEESGLTPNEASIELTKMGPKATLADLDPVLQSEASNVASFGGKPTAILKGTFKDRAASANDDAVQIFESKFGKKPDVYVERGQVKGAEADKIVEDARALTRADYKAAHASPQKLDVSGVVNNIDDQLQTAVGDKAAALEKIRGFFYRKDGTIKSSVKDLHEVREGIDDIINKTGDKLPPKALASVENIRTLTDASLKTNAKMAAADAKYAEKMKLKEGLQIGHEAITKGMNKQEFERMFDAATPEVQEKIKRGMLAAIGNKMEASSQGQMSETIKLFGKKDVNRANFKHAFGSNADDILEEISNKIAFRETENKVMHGSQTAERLGGQKAYGKGAFDNGSLLKDTVLGAAIDVSSGASGAATSMMAIRNLGSGARQKFIDVKLGNMEEGAADLLSRQGSMRDSAVKALDKIKERGDRSITTARDITSRLPVIAGTPLLDYARKKADKF